MNKELSQDAKLALGYVSGYPLSVCDEHVVFNTTATNRSQCFSIPAATVTELLRYLARLGATALAQEVGQGGAAPADKLSHDANLAVNYLLKWPGVKLDADAKRLHLFSPGSSADNFFSIPPATVLELIQFAARAAKAPSPTPAPETVEVADLVTMTRAEMDDHVKYLEVLKDAIHGFRKGIVFCKGANVKIQQPDDVWAEESVVVAKRKRQQAPDDAIEMLRKLKGRINVFIAEQEQMADILARFDAQQTQ